ncbi:MAG: RnfABCDGE type electron transport complex subunit A [Salinivirgaceae bacterium]|nr:RnfABCDGE type electron transport complex subunit A [Salinivirgaceae bacterium]
MTYFIIIITAIFVNNIVLNQFLGICPFLGVSKKISTAAGMSGAVMFVMVIATIVTYLIQTSVLAKDAIIEGVDLSFMQTITFILVIASLVQLVEIILKKVSPALYQALGVFLPLITTNCAILGVAIMTIQKDFSLMEGVVFAIASSIGFGLALVLFAGLREHMDLMHIPKGMKGIPIALVVAGILAMAFMGFSGLV